MKRIKKILASLMVAVMVLTAVPLSGFVGMELNLDWLSFDWLDFTPKASAATYNGTCGENLTWTFDDETGELVISGTGAMKKYSSQYVPWYGLRSSIQKITINKGTTSISYKAFSDCASLTSITIPDSVTSIGGEAFYNCTSLTTVTIPDGVTSIGTYAFRDCKNLESVTISDGVVSIEILAFYNTAYYNDSSNWDDGVLYIGNHLINTSSIISCAYTIKEGTRCIADNAFFRRTSLTSITIPDSVTSIGDYAFSDCSSLASVTIPDAVTSIGDNVFEDCDNLINVTIGNSVKNIGSSAFRYCSSLASVTIPGSVSSIGSGAFYDVCDDCIFYVEKDSYAETYAQKNKVFYYYLCNETEEKILSITVTSKLNFEINKETHTMTINCLGNMLSFVNEDAPWTQYKLYIKNIVINNDCTSIGDNAFVDFIGLKNIIIPDSVTSIGSSAFSGCTRLTSITIPNSVTSIGSSAFSGCTRLTSITIPNSVTNIGSSAFKGCSNLTSVTIGDNVTSVDSYTFSECIGLTSITLPNSLTSIGSSAFEGCSNLMSITIPDGVTNIGWSAFEDCDSLTSIVIPVSTSLSSGSFSGCTNIEKVTLTKGNGKTRNYTSSNYSYTPWYTSNESFTELVIEAGVSGIGDYMFYGCVNLENVILPESVRSIGNYAFTGCQKLEKITVNNPECTFGTESTSYYTTICGYAGSTAEAYANEMGFDFELIVPCEHNNYHIERKDSTCIETGYEKLICDDCGSTFSYTEIPRVDHDYKTITAPPTCLDEGTVVCLCRVCRDAYISEILDPLGHSELVWVTVKVPSTRNEGIMNQICPVCGEVFDTKTVPAISLSADSTANIDFETNTISGFDSGSSSIGDYLSATNNSYTFTCESEKIATGTVIALTAGDDMINEFEAVIFGDTNGDGWYDGQDAIIVDCLANGMLTKEDVSEAVYMAADCNHDGVIDQLDVALLNQAGTLLSNVDQSKPAEVLLETSSEYVEYLDLIDQSPELDIENETDAPEVDAETEDTTPEQDAKVDIFEMILNFIKSIFEMLLSYIPMPL